MVAVVEIQAVPGGSSVSAADRSAAARVGGHGDREVLGGGVAVAVADGDRLVVGAGVGVAAGGPGDQAAVC